MANLKKSSFFLLFYLLFVHHALFAQQTAVDYHKLGSKAIDNDNYIASIEYNTKAILLNPDYGAAYWDRGLAYDKTEEYKKALADYNKAISLYTNDKDLAILYTNRGKVYKHMEMYDSAMADLNLAIKKNPERTNSYWERATIYSKKNEDNAAIADYDLAIKYCNNKEDMALLLTNRAVEYNDLGKYADALIDLNAAVKYDRKCGTAWWNRADVSENMDLYENAVSDYTKAMKYYKKYPADMAKLYARRGSDYYELKKYKKALKDCNEALKIKPDYASAWWDLALIHEAMDDYANAINDYDNAITNISQISDKDKPKLYSNRAIINYNLKNYDSTIADDTRAIALHPVKGTAWWYRALALAAKDEHAAAIDDYTKAMGFYTDNQHSLSILYRNRGSEKTEVLKFDSAIIDLNKAIELDPNNADAYWDKGVAYAYKQDYTSSAEFYAKAIEYNTGKKRDLSLLYCNLGHSYEMLQKFDEADKNYTKSLEMNPVYYKGLKYRGRFYIKKLKDKERGEKDFKKLLSLDNGPDYYSAYCKFFLGDQSGAKEDLRQMLSNAEGGLSTELKAYYFDAACLYSIMDNETESIKYLELAIKKGFNGFDNLLTNQDLDNVRNSAAFKDILKKNSIN